MNKDQLGVSTLTWSEQPVLKAMEKAKENGYKWIDLGILNNWTDINPKVLAEDTDHTLSALEQKLEETGLQVAAINAGFGNSDYLIEEQCLALCKASKRLKSHAGVILPSGNRKEGWEQGLDILETAYNIFKEQKVNLMVETHFFHFTENIEDTMVLLKRFPGLRLTLDASHYIVQKYQPDDWKKLLPLVDHCHIRPCGEQGFDTIQVELEEAVPLAWTWPEVMLDWGYNGLFTLEIIDNMNVANTEETTKRMRDKLARKN